MDPSARHTSAMCFASGALRGPDLTDARRALAPHSHIMGRGSARALTIGCAFQYCGARNDLDAVAARDMAAGIGEIRGAGVRREAGQRVGEGLGERRYQGRRGREKVEMPDDQIAQPRGQTFESSTSDSRGCGGCSNQSPGSPLRLDRRKSHRSHVPAPPSKTVNDDCGSNADRQLRPISA